MIYSRNRVSLTLCFFIQSGFLSLTCVNTVPIVYQFHLVFWSSGYFCRFGCSKIEQKIIKLQPVPQSMTSDALSVKFLGCSLSDNKQALGIM